jgi:hypothetical protein
LDSRLPSRWTLPAEAIAPSRERLHLQDLLKMRKFLTKKRRGNNRLTAATFLRRYAPLLGERFANELFSAVKSLKQKRASI